MLEGFNSAFEMVTSIFVGVILSIAFLFLGIFVNHLFWIGILIVGLYLVFVFPIRAASMDIEERLQEGRKQQEIRERQLNPNKYA